MSTEIFTKEQWITRLLSIPNCGTESVTAFYDHNIGGICRDNSVLYIPLNDHLVHRGDGIFESISLLEGKIIQLDAHMDRLKRSAASIFLTPPVPWEQLREIAIDTARAGGEKNGHLKILLGRGLGKFGVAPRECPSSSLYLIAEKGNPPAESFWEKGLTAATSRIPAKQAWLAQIKSTNYLANALMTREAEKLGVDLTFAYDDHGFLAEGAIANVAILEHNGKFLFPHFRNALPGTTAIKAVDLAKSFTETLQTDITEKQVENAREVMILGSTPECASVVRYNGIKINGGIPGEFSKKLRKKLHENLIAEAVPFL